MVIGFDKARGWGEAWQQAVLIVSDATDEHCSNPTQSNLLDVFQRAYLADCREAHVGELTPWTRRQNRAAYSYLAHRRSMAATEESFLAMQQATEDFRARRALQAKSAAATAT